MKTPGLEILDVSTLRWTYFDFPATTTSVSTLSNGVVVANVSGSGIQLVSLDKAYRASEQLIPPTLTVRSLDKGRIVTVVPTNRDCVILLETATMSQVLTIPAQKNLPIPTDRNVVLCASLEDKIAFHCFTEGGEEHLQLWKPVYQYPQWTVQTNGSPSASGISPACTRLVTFHPEIPDEYIYIWDVHNGRLLDRKKSRLHLG